MENFNQLLDDYVRRAGISDAELARSIGVSRQTIFRWREGLTGRPRQREDVLVIARKLRLTSEERDKLLLAAGFRPEEEARRSGEQESGGVDEAKQATRSEREDKNLVSKVEVDAHLAPTPEASPPISPPLASSLFKRRWWVAGASLLLIVITAWLVNQKSNDDLVPSTPAVRFTSPPVFSSPAPARPDETVVLVTHFANYASSQVGYNVAGRLAQTLQQEVANVRLENIRIAIWPQPVGEREEALRVGREISATLVIFGEYDVGRIMVRFVEPADQSAPADPVLQHYVADVQDLSAAINTDLPQQVRPLALLALGRIYLAQNHAEQARPLLLQARDHLQDNSQVDQQTWALINFYLGIAYHYSQPAYLDEAIAAYSQAIQAWPEMISSRLNRSVAYAARQESGDLPLALADADQVVAAKPDWAEAYNNRGSIRLNIGGAKNLTLALSDMEKALTLDAKLPEAYFNRAYIHFQQGLSIEKVTPDLDQALVLHPNYANALNLFCWGYAIEEQPKLALPYCQQAVTADPQPIFFDSRGLTYALLGDYPAAIADFKTYVVWLEQQPGKFWQTSLIRRRTWIRALETGQNPFTPQILAELRYEFDQQK